MDRRPGEIKEGTREPRTVAEFIAHAKAGGGRTPLWSPGLGTSRQQVVTVAGIKPGR
jgi:hypothetical protein